MEENNSLSAHVDALNKIILDLEDIGVKIKDKDKAIILLSSLPHSYEHFVDTLLYGRQTLTMQDVNESLSSKESSKKSEIRDVEGLTARERIEKRESWKGKKKMEIKVKKKTLKCFMCHKEGYFKRDYPKRKNKPKEGKDKNGNAAIAFDQPNEGYNSAGVLLAYSN